MNNQTQAGGIEQITICYTNIDGIKSGDIRERIIKTLSELEKSEITVITPRPNRYEFQLRYGIEVILGVYGENVEPPMQKEHEKLYGRAPQVIATATIKTPTNANTEYFNMIGQKMLEIKKQST